jgi:hypothetical protein
MPIKSILDSIVAIETGYGLEDRGIIVRVPEMLKIVSSPRRPDRLWGPPSLLCKRYLELLAGSKAAGTCSFSPTSAEVKEVWIYTSTPPYSFMA